MKATIAIVDDHPVFRRGLISVIREEYEQLEIMWEVSDGDALLEVLASSAVPPDLCILDLNMPGIGGYETLKILTERYPSLKVLVYTTYKHPFSIAYALNLGAAGYISKDAPIRQLTEAISSILKTGLYHAAVTTGGFHLLFHQVMHPEKALQDRELEYIRLSCAGLSNEKIADRMHLSPRTLGGYRDRIYEKLQIHNKAGLVRFAIETGLYRGVEHPDLKSP